MHILPEMVGMVKCITYFFTHHPLDPLRLRQKPYSMSPLLEQSRVKDVRSDELLHLTDQCKDHYRQQRCGF